MFLVLSFILLWSVSAAIGAWRDRGRISVGSDLESVPGFFSIAVLPSRSPARMESLDDSMLRLAGDVEMAYRTKGVRSLAITAASASTGIAVLSGALQRKLVELGFEVGRISCANLLDEARGKGKAGGAPAQADRERLIEPDESEKMKASLVAKRLEEMKAEYDFVLIESPALLHSISAEYVVRHTDAAILVGQTHQTSRREWSDAIERLQIFQVTVLGAIVDRPPMRFMGEALRKEFARPDSQPRIKVEAGIEIGCEVQRVTEPKAEIPGALEVSARRMGGEERRDAEHRDTQFLNQLLIERLLQRQSGRTASHERREWDGKLRRSSDVTPRSPATEFSGPPALRASSSDSVFSKRVSPDPRAVSPLTTARWDPIPPLRPARIRWSGPPTDAAATPSETQAEKPEGESIAESAAPQYAYAADESSLSGGTTPEEQELSGESLRRRKGD